MTFSYNLTHSVMLILLMCLIIKINFLWVNFFVLIIVSDLLGKFHTNLEKTKKFVELTRISHLRNSGRPKYVLINIYT